MDNSLKEFTGISFEPLPVVPKSISVKLVHTEIIQLILSLEYQIRSEADYTQREKLKTLREKLIVAWLDGTAPAASRSVPAVRHQLPYPRAGAAPGESDKC